MDEEIQDDKKIIGLAETIFVMLLVGAEEFVEFIILVITLGTGIMVVEIMNGAVGALIEMYMLLRGGRGIMKLVVEPIGTFINGATASLAPGKTIALGAGIWIINHPEEMDKVAKVVAKVGGAAFKVAATTAGGIVGGVAGGIPGGVAGGVAGGTTAGLVGGIAGGSASGARQRMEMATGASSKKIEGINRARQAQERAKQSMSKEVPQGIPEEAA